MMCHDVLWCAMHLGPSFFLISFQFSQLLRSLNSRFAKKTLGDMEMLQRSGSPLHVSFWPAHPGRDVFWKIDATTTSRNSKQRQAKKKYITRHHVPYWAILSHIGPYDDICIYMCLRCSSTTAPVLYNGAHVVLGSNMLRRFNCHKQECKREILQGNCCKQDTSQYFRNLGSWVRKLRDPFDWKLENLTEALASSPLTPMQVTQVTLCPQQKGSTSNWTMAFIFSCLRLGF